MAALGFGPCLSVRLSVRQGNSRYEQAKYSRFSSQMVTDLKVIWAPYLVLVRATNYTETSLF